MSRPLPQITTTEALEALQRSGYLLESRVEAVLRAHDFRVEANTLVPDDLTGKMREVDLWAGGVIGYQFGPEQQGGLALELVIECVNPPQPVAFITKERPDPFYERTRIWDALKLVGNPQEEHTSPHNSWDWLTSKLDLRRYHHYQVGRISTQYCSFSKKSSSSEWMAHHRDEDYQTLRKLCVATDHFIGELVVPGYAAEGGWNLTLVYPVLVVRAPLYEVRPSKRSARIVRTNHVQYRCRQVVHGEAQDYQIDVITEPHLPHFLTLLQREMRLISRRIDRRYPELAAFRAERQVNLRNYYSAHPTE
jgi:hypothetical protein